MDPSAGDHEVPASTSSSTSTTTGAAMTERAQKERRNSIRDILADDSLTPFEKRRSIQSLMDGRRRSSNATHSSDDSNNNNGSRSMARAAAEAAEYYSSDTDDDMQVVVTTGDNNNHNNNNHNGESSSSSSNNNNNYNQYYGYGQQQGQNDPNRSSSSSGENPQRRKERSASLPGWSDVGLAAPLAAASTNSIWDDPININRRMEKSRPACNHYERNCSIISPCCGLAFGCRICHDECPVLPMPFSKRPNHNNNNNTTTAAAGAAGGGGGGEGSGSGVVGRINWADNVDNGGGMKQKMEKRRSLPLGFEEEETHHEIDRFAIAEIICRLCYIRQPSKTNFCNTCQAQFGAYHCNICNLWMSDEESPYHCADCGFCRVGGRENFRHCDDCGMCIDTLLFDDHNCKAGKYMSNCPVCQEDLFSSRDASHEMPCGHAIHWHCFKELTSYDTRCPVCKKTAETPEHMAPTWQAMAMGIALQPVPPELARVVTIMCNDCEERDEDRRWHFLGVRCMNCMSFNTTVERTSLTGREASAYLDQLDHERGGGGGEDGSGMNGDMGPAPMDDS